MLPEANISHKKIHVYFKPIYVRLVQHSWAKLLI